MYTVVNGAGLYEPPSSYFWVPPGISPLAEDPIDAKVGQYKTFAVNTIVPIRFAQIDIDYCLETRDIKASMIKSFVSLRKEFGIRNSAIYPDAVYTSIFHPDYCKDRFRPDYLTMTPGRCSSVVASVLQEPQYGDGNIIETMIFGTKAEPVVSIREVPLEALYHTAGPVGQDEHLFEEDQKLVKQLKEKKGRTL